MQYFFRPKNADSGHSGLFKLSVSFPGYESLLKEEGYRPWLLQVSL